MEYTPFSAKRVFGITILESIYGFSALLLSKQTTGSFAYVLGPGFISQKKYLVYGWLRGYIRDHSVVALWNNP